MTVPQTANSHANQDLHPIQIAAPGSGMLALDLGHRPRHLLLARHLVGSGIDRSKLRAIFADPPPAA
jgi:hypothetical protein